MSVVQIAGLLADQTRATFCFALLDGRAWTAGELARHAGVSPSTASEHLSRLVGGGLVVEERQGRHRYVRLAGPDAAALIEGLASYDPVGPASAGSPSPIRTSPIRTSPIRTSHTGTSTNLRESARASAEARARTCYDHLAGQLGVAVADAIVGRGFVADDAGLAVTGVGLAWLAGLGVELPTSKRSRPMVLGCLDWTERRVHLAGALGAALCARAFDQRWVRRIGSGRALSVTPDGKRAFRSLLGIDL